MCCQKAVYYFVMFNAYCLALGRVKRKKYIFQYIKCDLHFQLFQNK